jgi:hypothetical protein
VITIALRPGVDARLAETHDGGYFVDDYRP